MVLKVHGSALSACSKLVATVLAEKQVPFEFIEVGYEALEHKSPAHIAHQPFGQIPYIVF
jgi:glutathione S-transferase